MRSMVRSMTVAAHSRSWRGALAAATLAFAAAVPPLRAQTDSRPVVVVFTFDNNSIGKDRADFDNLSKGVQDLLITDLASNSRIRLVDRARVQELLQEQNLVKTGAVDPATAIRLGKMLGAQYAITGGFLADTRSGNAVLTARTIDMESSQIGNPEKITGRADDVVGLISQLSARLASGVTLAPKPGRRSGDAESGKTAPAQTGSPTGASSSSAPSRSAMVETYARPVSPNAMQSKLDAATLRVYSNALDEADRKNASKAAMLFREVLDKYPDFEPAKVKLEKLSGA